MGNACIAINSLAKEFKAKNGNIVRALDNINLEVKENEFVCILGPSGCGKSTLLRIVAGLEKPSAGLVLYRGKPKYKPDKKVGMVFQDYSLFPWRTVEENIALGLEFQKVKKKERLAVARQYLEMVGMENFSQAYPYELSGGMQQRVAIVRALANDPDVILMDEPFGALDAHTRFLMQRELLKIWENHKKTILFVTHSVDEALYLADKIVVMSTNPGKIAEVINVKMLRPRNRTNSYYGQLADYILGLLDGEIVKEEEAVSS